MTTFLLKLMAFYAPWIAAFLFAFSAGLIAFAWFDQKKVRRSLLLLLILFLLLMELMMVVPLQLGSFANMLLLFWAVFHLWLMGKFDR